MTDWDNRPKKVPVRRWSYASKKKNFNHALMLPAANFMDVKLVLELNYKIGHYTFVERDAQVFEQMVKGHSNLVENKLLVEGSAKLIKGELSSLIFDDDRPLIDLAVLDLCGNINNNLALWIMFQLKPNLAKNALLGFTFTYNPRGVAGTHEEFSEWMMSEYPQRYKRNLRDCRRTDSAEKALESAYKTFFQIVFPESIIGHPIAYRDTAYKMMTWRFWS